MTNNLSSFGFVYDYEGKEYSFVVVASSLEEAKGRAAAMGGAKLFGELHEVGSALCASDAETALAHRLGSSLANIRHEPRPTE